ncbi:hypothetical protein [Pedobacter rhodius]|uniref:Uncharacterized protein n=1 Tax=Pedobacter rhodius TaxID=3004098 RepID=A0ABT4KWF3_9SPHI|nr:hypothetical protein [Pedobacter sp. SJ11]MCZ4223256.1 hypothetical protein [Pedobacter sp. SJ11]
MMVWNQNIDLVRYNDKYGVLNYGQTGANRLFTGLEYVAKYNVGQTVPYHPFYEYCNNVYIYPNGISASGRGNFSPMWEMAVSLFNKASLSPVYSQMVVSGTGYRPEKTNSDHSGLGTLLYTTTP